MSLARNAVPVDGQDNAELIPSIGGTPKFVHGLIAIKQFQELYMKAQSLVGATAALAICLLQNAYAEQPPSPCHPNPNAAADSLTVRTRGDIAELPDPLKDRLAQLADRPHTFLPIQVFAEADKAGQLVQYYLLD